MKAPARFVARQLRDWPVSTETRDGAWIPARPLAFNHGLLHRIRLAWAVLMGRYDALDWEEHR